MALPTFRKPTGGWNGLWEPLCWLFFAAGAYLVSLSFDGPLPTYALGAAFWPKAVCAIIALSASALLVTRLIRGKPDSEPEDAERPADDRPADSAVARYWTALLFALPLAWAFAMHKVGFLLATPVFLLVFTRVMGVTRIRTLVVFGLGFYAAIVAVFYKLIFTPLPMGAGWFNALNGKFLGLIQ